jgi:choloylglycine hydrolase
MDWSGIVPTNLWLFPKGTKQNGAVTMNGSNRGLEWTSKYDSFTTSTQNMSNSSGMNEKGLVVDTLWLPESVYEDYTPLIDGGSSKKGLAMSIWLQYVLDNFATVQEVVDGFRQETFILVTDYMPEDVTKRSKEAKLVTQHMAVSDASGDNAIFEYIDGQLKIYHDRTHTVLTNSPVYPKQLAIYEHWRDVNKYGLSMLPGTNRAADRFVRAKYYSLAVVNNATTDQRTAVAAVFSIIRNCSTPVGITGHIEGDLYKEEAGAALHSEISNTQWRTVADQTELVYYYENVFNPNIIYLRFRDELFSKIPAGEVGQIVLNKDEDMRHPQYDAILSGNVKDEVIYRKSFKFLPVELSDRIKKDLAYCRTNKDQ